MLVETMTDGLSEIDQNGVATYANDRLCEMWGYTKAEIIGRPVVDFLDEENRRLLEAQLEERKKGRYKSYELVWTRKDGQKIHTHMSPRPFYDKRGKFQGSFAVITDITQRKEEQENLRKARDELEKRVEERTRELEIKTNNLEEVNTALRVLLKKRDEDRTEIEERVLQNVRELVLPYLEKLRRCNLDKRQKTWMEIIDSTLNDIISPFTQGLHSGYMKLTPMEVQVADLVKNGKTTKEIAELLNLSPQTIACHRKSIRKKIGIRNRKANLRSHLSAIQ